MKESFHHEELFGNLFEIRAKYCCGVLGSHHCRVQSKKQKQIPLLMAKEIKAKGYNVIPGHSLCHQYVKNISWRVIRMNQMLSRMNQIMTTLVKRLGRSSIPALTLWVSPLSIYMMLLNTVGLQLQIIIWMEQFTKTIIIRYLLSVLINFASSETVNVISETEQKASELDRLHNLMTEKLTNAMHSEKIQILTLAPDSWSRQYCAEHFNVSEYLVRTAKEL